ncbi:MAG: metalloregulator ArsR/SmtB family transcription factor, partial [bacterium]
MMTQHERFSSSSIIRGRKTRINPAAIAFLLRHFPFQISSFLLFGALANETRLRILNLLIETPLCVKEIAQILGLPHNNISQNLKLLHHAG